MIGEGLVEPSSCGDVEPTCRVFRPNPSSRCVHSTESRIGTTLGPPKSRSPRPTTSARRVSWQTTGRWHDRPFGCGGRTRPPSATNSIERVLGLTPNRLGRSIRRTERSGRRFSRSEDSVASPSHLTDHARPSASSSTPNLPARIGALAWVVPRDGRFLDRAGATFVWYGPSEAAASRGSVESPRCGRRCPVRSVQAWEERRTARDKATRRWRSLRPGSDQFVLPTGPREQAGASRLVGRILLSERRPVGEPECRVLSGPLGSCMAGQG